MRRRSIPPRHRTDSAGGTCRGWPRTVRRLDTRLLAQPFQHRQRARQHRLHAHRQALPRGLLAQLEQAFTQLSSPIGQPGHDLTDHEWLMAVRSRAAMPGGTCSFDLPAYHTWQHGQAASRRADLHRWVSSLSPMAQAITLLLQILRTSGKPRMLTASAGQYQMGLPQGRTVQMLRLRLDESLSLVPEISGNRLAVSVRLMRMQPDGKLQVERIDAPFELALCT